MRLWHVIVLCQPVVGLGEHFGRGKACECGHVKVGLVGVQCETIRMGYDGLPDQDLGIQIGRMVDQSIVHASLEFLPHPSACRVRSLLPCLLLHLLPTSFLQPCRLPCCLPSPLFLLLKPSRSLLKVGNTLDLTP